MQTAEVKLHFWDIFDTFLVYLKNTLLVCNTKNIPPNDMNIKNISLATQKHIKKSVWVHPLCIVDLKCPLHPGVNSIKHLQV